MKKSCFSRLCWTVAAVVAVVNLSSCSKEKFHVEGDITNAKDSVLYFEHNGLDGFAVVDSVKLDESGAFSFSGDKADNTYTLIVGNDSYSDIIFKSFFL